MVKLAVASGSSSPAVFFLNIGQPRVRFPADASVIHLFFLDVLDVTQESPKDCVGVGHSFGGLLASVIVFEVILVCAGSVLVRGCFSCPGGCESIKILATCF